MGQLIKEATSILQRLGTLPSNNGLMFLFDKQTGKPICALLDEGYLTDMRTAAAG